VARRKDEEKKQALLSRETALLRNDTFLTNLKNVAVLCGRKEGSE